MTESAGCITESVATFATLARADVAKSPTDRRSAERYVPNMAISPIAQWVAKAAGVVGGQAELARLVSKELRRDLDRAAVNKMCSGGRTVSAEEMLAIEAV